MDHPLPRRAAGALAVMLLAGTLPAHAQSPAVPGADAAGAGTPNTAGTSSASGASAPPGASGAAARRDYDIPPGPLAATLNRFAEQAGVYLTAAAELTQGKVSGGLRGQHDVPAAFERLLRGTGLQAVPQAGGAYTLRRLAESPAPGSASPAAAVAAAVAVARPPTLTPVEVTADALAETATGPVSGYLAKRSATATKTDTPIIETPQSISVVTADFAEAIGATRLRDALGYTPGINIAPYGSDSRYDWVFLRGFDAYTPGYYLDGLQLRNNGTWAVWRTENQALERIEVLRGPTSVLYGQNGPGGMINVVGKRPSETRSRQLQAQWGSFSHKQLSGDFTGPIDDDNKLLYRFIGVWRDAELPVAGMRDDRLFVAPSLTWKPTDRTRLNVELQYLRDRAGVYTRSVPYEGSLIDNPNGRIAPRRFLGDAGVARFDHTQTLFGYQLDHRVDEVWSLHQQARYGQMRIDYVGVSPGGSFLTADAANPDDPANFRVVPRTVFGSSERVHGVTIDNRAQARFGVGDWRHTVVLGIDHQRTRYDVTTYSGDSGTTIDVFSGVVGGALTLPAPAYLDGNVRLEQTGLYLQEQVKFRERWVATLGGRFDLAKVDSDDRLGGTRSIQNDHRFSKRIGLVHLAPNGVAPYVSYSDSFSPNVALDPVSGRPFDAETGRQIEAGLRYEPVGRRDRYSIAAFELTRRNMITYDSIGTPRRYGEVRVRGIEMEAAFRPLDRANVVGSLTWTPQADVTRSANPDEIGKQANAVPRYQAALWVDYRWASALRTGVGARYVGTTRGTSEGAPIKVPAYLLFDASIGYDIGQVSLALSVRNLTDEKYLAQCGWGVCQYGDARRVLGTVTYRW